MSTVTDLRAAVAHLTPTAAIYALLDTASVLADLAATDEQRASDPFTSLAQQIDYALARVEKMEGAAIAALQASGEE